MIGFHGGSVRGYEVAAILPCTQEESQLGLIAATDGEEQGPYRSAVYVVGREFPFLSTDWPSLMAMRVMDDGGEIHYVDRKDLFIAIGRKARGSEFGELDGERVEVTEGSPTVVSWSGGGKIVHRLEASGPLVREAPKYLPTAEHPIDGRNSRCPVDTVTRWRPDPHSPRLPACLTDLLKGPG